MQTFSYSSTFDIRHMLSIAEMIVGLLNIVYNKKKIQMFLLNVAIVKICILDKYR